LELRPYWALFFRASEILEKKAQSAQLSNEPKTRASSPQAELACLKAYPNINFMIRNNLSLECSNG
jgi:hypothetical protein